MDDLLIEEKIRLFEMAAKQVSTYEDNRLFSYATKVRALLDAIMTFEVVPTNALEAIERLESVLQQLEEKIQKRQNFEIVMRLLD
ncbi:hypothetical protein [Desertivirga arenae]|uniref:hypothetical protein n=1 Tax=Desertivirga arenae TaxID=2810309 RepID=UPI001A9760C9|nr:hypothetical protein [Pedobacter sp. SYSU D00823]